MLLSCRIFATENVFLKLYYTRKPFKMGDNEDNNEFVYETDEKGASVMVRSMESRDRAIIRFVNRTTRPVDVWWRDFEGYRRHYMRMVPRSTFNVDTFLTHPWEFTDPVTRENYLINNRRIFRPPNAIAGMRHRTNWIISICIRTLRSTVMLSLAQRLTSQDQVMELGLPRELEVDLEQLIDAIQHTPPPPQRP